MLPKFLEEKIKDLPELIQREFEYKETLLAGGTSTHPNISKIHIFQHKKEYRKSYFDQINIEYVAIEPEINFIEYQRILPDINNHYFHWINSLHFKFSGKYNQNI